MVFVEFSHSQYGVTVYPRLINLSVKYILYTIFMCKSKVAQLKKSEMHMNFTMSAECFG